MKFIQLCLILLIPLINACATTETMQKTAPVEDDQLERFNVIQLMFNNDLTTLTNLIDTHQLNVKTARGIFHNTITHELVRNPEALILVLDKGAPLDDFNDMHETPLSIAVSQGYLASAQELITRGAHLDGQFSFDNSLMHLAASHEDVAMIKLLIKHQVCPLYLGFMGQPLTERLSPKVESVILEYIKEYKSLHGNSCPKPKKDHKAGNLSPSLTPSLNRSALVQ